MVFLSGVRVLSDKKVQEIAVVVMSLTDMRVPF